MGGEFSGDDVFEDSFPSCYKLLSDTFDRERDQQETTDMSRGKPQLQLADKDTMADDILINRKSLGSSFTLDLPLPQSAMDRDITCPLSFEQQVAGIGFYRDNGARVEAALASNVNNHDQAASALESGGRVIRRTPASTKARQELLPTARQLMLPQSPPRIYQSLAELEVSNPIDIINSILMEVQTLLLPFSTFELSTGRGKLEAQLTDFVRCRRPKGFTGIAEDTVRAVGIILAHGMSVGKMTEEAKDRSWVRRQLGLEGDQNKQRMSKEFIFARVRTLCFQQRDDSHSQVANSRKAVSLWWLQSSLHAAFSARSFCPSIASGHTSSSKETVNSGSRL